ncbi:MAG: type IV secretion system DNA-binding domain-containing protein [Candidatus Falkowbacteria bacterium]|nr:MAG: type IV secretion system DNA-binding domain-containing protein [Candidatus Falkowbacteria bacterium]
MAGNIAVFAQTNYRNELKKFGIKTDDRRRHMYLIGKTGMGKSTVLENMIVDDIRNGYGVAVVDPHGDLAEKIMDYIPNDRLKDVVYFNPSDINFPIAFNVVEQVEPHLRHLVASGLIGVFQKLWADSWGPRLEYILRNAILAILDFPGSTLLGVVRMLSDKGYRKRVVANITDPVVKAFWEKEFSGYADKFASEAVSPIQNKVGQFLSSSLMRNIIGQVKSAIDIRDIMDNGKILIMNLSKGRIGEDNSALLGAMMITKIQLAAMSRVDIPEKERRDFYLYIDEFQNFSTDSFANILSEARKYRLNLILAHQYIEQLSEKVKPAVFGNVGTLVVFRVGAADAEELVKEFTPTFTEEDIVNLPKYEMYLKLMIDGIASSPFSAIGLPPLRIDERTNNTEKVINYSREKYASDRESVEEKIMRWHESYGEDEKSAPRADIRIPAQNLGASPTNVYSPAVPVSTQSSAPYQNQTPSKPILKAPNANFPVSPFKEKSGYDAVCASCGVATKIAFIPDGIRPVYCKDCLSKKKEEKRLELEARKQAKEIERKGLVEVKDEPIFQPEATLSLGDLNKMAPVDFKGRVIKTPAPKETLSSKEAPILKPSPANSSQLSPVNKNSTGSKNDGSIPVADIVSEVKAAIGQEQDLPEGADIIIK